ncbi:30S ribosome-binding factor [Candidatus Ecksteinia adelgidicola]|nr:30S ribosome-binding factor [Candidatus Ecksteinia adelgidicola]
MEHKFNRNQRVEQEIKKKIAFIIQYKIKNPYVFMTTISDAKISKDLAYVKIYITFFNTLDENYDLKIIKKGMKKLQSSSDYIRILLGKVMRLRIVPQLTFIYDNSEMQGRYISNLVNNIIENN